MMLSAIAEAQGDGARLAQACRVVGLSMRTIERWRNEPERGDGRRGPHHRPHNALSPAEEAQVVSVLTSSRYAGLSPKQLVPQLADEGLYLASESTIFAYSDDMGCGRRSVPRVEHMSPEHARFTERLARTRSGAGTSPCSRRRCAAYTSACTSSWMFGAAALSDGESLNVNPQN